MDKKTPLTHQEPLKHVLQKVLVEHVSRRGGADTYGRFHASVVVPHFPRQHVTIILLRVGMQHCKRGVHPVKHFIFVLQKSDSSANDNDFKFPGGVSDSKIFFSLVKHFPNGGYRSPRT